jgi:isopenicillin N synthase-like dioxygenase
LRGTGGGERKLPRVDLRKLLGGEVAGRREAVTLIGDALREQGAVRIEGHRAPDPGGGDERDALAAVGEQLLVALADYFGLRADAFGSGRTAMADAAGATGRPALLVVLAGVPAGTELRAGSEPWRVASAHPGELLAVPGPALALLTGGVVAAAAVRWPPDATLGVALVPDPGAALDPLAAFVAASG